MSQARRRKLLLAGGVLLAAPLLANAQQETRVRRVGFLAARSQSTPSHPDIYYDAFVRAMKDLGYINGRNLAIEWRFANNENGQMPALATDLAKTNPEVIVTNGTQASLAVQAVTRKIPVVCLTATDPVGSGLATSLARPGGNFTGLTNIASDTGPKLVEFVKEVLPRVSRVAALVNPSNPTHPPLLKSLRVAANKFKIAITEVDAQNAAEIDSAFMVAAKANAEAVIVVPDAVFAGQSAHVAALALKHRLLTMSAFPEDAAAGLLMSYGQSNVEHYQRAAAFVDKILKGVLPGEIPFEQTTTLRLAINRKTAKALGIAIPLSMLQRADEVIE